MHNYDVDNTKSIKKKNTAKFYAQFRGYVVRVPYESILELVVVRVWSVMSQQNDEVITLMARYHDYPVLRFILFANARSFIFLCKYSSWQFKDLYELRIYELVGILNNMLPDTV